MSIQLKVNNIYIIDCIKGIKQMKKQSFSVDVIVTSPPYNIGKDYNTYDDRKSRNEYLDWMESVARQCSEIMNDQSSFCFNQLYGTIIFTVK